MPFFQNPPISKIKEILQISKTVAVVGASIKPERASHGIAEYLMKQGYIVYLVNPKYHKVSGEICCASLHDITGSVDIVNVFRRPDKVMPIAMAAVEIGASTFWMQDLVINEEVANYARENGLNVIMDRCIYRDHHFLI